MIDVQAMPSLPPLHLSYTPGSSKRLVVSLAGVGHTLARTLHDAEHLAPIVTPALLRRPFKLRRAMRQAGGMSREKFDRLHTTPLSEEAL